MGILGPVLLVLLCLWLGRGERSPVWVKVLLAGFLALLMLILLGYI